MRLLELFSGTESMGKVFKEAGWEVLSIDNNPAFKSDICADILTLDPPEGEFDVVWASPPCTAFSVASIGYHWRHGKPSAGARLGVKLLTKTMEFIMVARPKYWFIENPRGMMRKLPIMFDLPKRTVTYCQYGDSRMKPTDIWTNCDIWTPKPACKNGDTCHTPAPRGCETGTQGIKSVIDRSRIPDDLCREILRTVQGQQIGLFD